jgi:phasin family protein
VTKTTTNPFKDLNSMLTQLKLPGVDTKEFTEARRKDIEALVEANRVAYEGMHALARKQAEILKQGLETLQAAGHKATTQAKTGAEIQVDAAQQALQKSFENMRALAEMAQRSQAEAVAIIGKRAAEDFDEIRKLGGTQ